MRKLCGVAFLALWGCGEPMPGLDERDGGQTLVDPVDAAADVDAREAPDAAWIDVDASAIDAGVDVDAAPVDAAPVDAAPVDAAPVDAAPVDAFVADATPPPDAFVADAGPPPPPLAEGVATLTGSWQDGFVDGVRGEARFSNPVNVLAGPDGRLFVADYDNHAIRVVDGEGTASTLVAQADFQRPFGLALHEGTLYVSTDRNDQLQQHPHSGTIWAVPLAGGAATVVARDVGRPRGLTALPDGRLVLVDNQHHTVRLLTPGASPVLLAGAVDEPGFLDGLGGAARFRTPYGVVFDGQDLLVADKANHRIRRVTLAGQVTSFAGSGARGWADGPGATASFDEPQALALDPAGNLLVGDSNNFCLRHVAPDGWVQTLAGDRTPGFADGYPLEAHFFGMEGLAAAGGYLFVADGTRGDEAPYHRVRRVSLAAP